MILLFTDFGAEGPYLGQMEAVLRQAAPTIPVINLVSNAPAGDPRRASYLLAALARYFPVGSVFLAVVDPGVGGERAPVVVRAAGRWFVGPDNGLFNPVAAGAGEWWRILWRPESLSSSFHGRDLFAPIAARVALGDMTWEQAKHTGPDAWPLDLPEIVYIDHYGNAISGLRYDPAFDGRILIANGHRIRQADTFCAVAEGEALWYRNSMDLVEIAVNRGRADQALNLILGTPLEFI